MMSRFLGDSSVMMGRSMRHILRSPDTIITTAITPIAMMLMFLYVLGGAVDPGGRAAYVKYILPGILLITIASGISYTNLRLFTDRRSGIFERFHSMPIARSSVLWAHVLTALVANAISLVIVVLVAMAVGFRSSAGVVSWLGITALLCLFTVALTWIAVLAALAAKTAEGAGAFAYPLIFLPFLSSAMVPTKTMPGALQAFANNQPVTPVVNSIRALIDNQAVGNQAWLAAAWLGGVLVVFYALSIMTYRRQIA
ncbi:ABC transporter permease [Catenulispora sp. EB89]|uniref:ABC transporter permease n=1 Tax=Catenulispora sp. EB89 TaxID=3156257 RepID=UPI0035154329